MPSQVSDAFAALTIRYNWLRKLVGWTLAVPLSIRKREQVLGVVFGPEQAPKDFPIRGGGLLGLRPSHFIAASRDLTSVEEVLPQMQARYDDLKLPIGILYGREDADRGWAHAADYPARGVPDVYPCAPASLRCRGLRYLASVMQVTLAAPSVNLWRHTSVTNCVFGKHNYVQGVVT